MASFEVCWIKAGSKVKELHKQLMALHVGHGKLLQTYTGLDRFA